MPEVIQPAELARRAVKFINRNHAASGGVLLALLTYAGKEVGARGGPALGALVRNVSGPLDAARFWALEWGQSLKLFSAGKGIQASYTTRDLWLAAFMGVAGWLGLRAVFGAEKSTAPDHVLYGVSAPASDPSATLAGSRPEHFERPVAAAITPVLSGQEVLLGMLKEYQPTEVDEKSTVAQSIDFLKQKGTRAFRRHSHDWHFAVSAWVVNDDHTKVLLLQDSSGNWSRPAGHFEESDKYDAKAAALRGLVDNTGLWAEDVTWVQDGIFAVEKHDVRSGNILDAQGKTVFEPAHVEYDVGFLLSTDESKPLKLGPTIREAKWVPLAEAPKYSIQPDMRRFLVKMAKTKSDREDAAARLTEGGAAPLAHQAG